MFRSLFVLVGAGLLAVLAGCQSAAKTTGPIRAMWVTRYDYTTPADVKQIMSDCADAGLNTVVFQVRGNGTVCYPSKIEPWAKQFNHTDPGFDPLKLAIKEARRRDLALHAWVNVMPAWMGPGEPPMSDQLYHAHPDWFWYDVNGVRQPIHHQVGDRHRDWYVSINPCLPEVRDYLVEVFSELLRNYRVDGLHLDYIRFPNERVVPDEKIPDYPHDPRTRALFAAAHDGATPESHPDQWNDWRTEQVTEIVRRTYAAKQRLRPSASLSAAVGVVPVRALTHFQDAQTWLDEGILDRAFLMNYTASFHKFTERIVPWKATTAPGKLVPGLIIRDKEDVDATVQVTTAQINAARTATGNFCVFAYSMLFDSPNTETDSQDAPTQQRRAARRAALVSMLQALADADAGD